MGVPVVGRVQCALPLRCDVASTRLSPSIRQVPPAARVQLPPPKGLPHPAHPTLGATASTQGLPGLGQGGSTSIQVSLGASWYCTTSPGREQQISRFSMKPKQRNSV